MKTCGIFTFFVAATGLIFGAVGQEPECTIDELSDAALEQLDMYDKNLYLEPDCVNGHQPLPMHCNYMGLGQECRGCYMTCCGVMQYIQDYAEEYAIWGEAVVNFCPGAEVDAVENCHSD